MTAFSRTEIKNESAAIKKHNVQQLQQMTKTHTHLNCSETAEQQKY